MLINSSQAIKYKRRHSHLLVAESDRIITDLGDSSKDIESASETPIGSTTPVEQESKKSPPSDSQSMPKKVPLTARERLRAARLLSRYSESKPKPKSEMGRSVLDALRESEKGKKGLPKAPTDLFDDSKRGMPKAGLTFDFPGGFDLFVIAFSFVFISTVMFATTYIVWKVGAIHFNEY